jgi:hypothetical protein
MNACRVPGVFVLGALLALATGCASVPTTVDPGDYRKIGNKTVRVQTVQNEKVEAIGVWCSDSTMILDRALYPGYDRHEYPRTIQLKDVRSVATLQHESLVYVESGVEWGRNYGVESSSFAKTVMTTEIGYLSGERASQPRSTLGFGATFYFMASFEDFRGGIKARGRYRYNRHFSLDLAAGPMIKHNAINGYVASLGFNIGPYVTLKSEYQVFDIPAWREYVYTPGPGDEYVYYPGGNERVWYNGIALRNGAGWIATVAGTIGMFVAMVVALSALGGSS